MDSTSAKPVSLHYSKVVNIFLSSIHKWMDLFLSFLCCSVGPSICSCGNTIDKLAGLYSKCLCLVERCSTSRVCWWLQFYIYFKINLSNSATFWGVDVVLYCFYLFIVFQLSNNEYGIYLEYLNPFDFFHVFRLKFYNFLRCCLPHICIVIPRIYKFKLTGVNIIY